MTAAGVKTCCWAHRPWPHVGEAHCTNDCICMSPSLCWWPWAVSPSRNIPWHCAVEGMALKAQSISCYFSSLIFPITLHAPAFSWLPVLPCARVFTKPKTLPSLPQTPLFLSWSEPWGKGSCSWGARISSCIEELPKIVKSGWVQETHWARSERWHSGTRRGNHAACPPAGQQLAKETGQKG